MEQEEQEIREALIRKAQKGDQQAMYRIYQQYVDRMYNVCIRMVNNRYDAEDILQEAFVKAFRQLKSFRFEAGFGSWLRRIVVNESLNFLRKRKDWQSDLSMVADETHNEEEIGFPDIPVEKVHFAIRELPEKARLVFTLYLVEEYRHREIAEMLNISVSTSKSQYQRACKLLREQLRPEIEFEEKGGTSHAN